MGRVCFRIDILSCRQQRCCGQSEDHYCTNWGAGFSKINPPVAVLGLVAAVEVLWGVVVGLLPAEVWLFKSGLVDVVVELVWGTEVLTPSTFPAVLVAVLAAVLVAVTAEDWS